MEQGFGGILLPDLDPRDMCGPRISSRNFFLRSITANIRNQREAEFLMLKQGNMTLTEYERKFEQGLRNDLR